MADFENSSRDRFHFEWARATHPRGSIVRDPIIEAAAAALKKALAGKNVSDEKRVSIVRRAHAAVQEEGEWPTQRRLRLWYALKEAAGLPVPEYEYQRPQSPAIKERKERSARVAQEWWAKRGIH